MKYYYHATPYENLPSVLCDGLKPGPDGLVYLCEKPEDCCKFLYVRGCRNILTVRVKVTKRLENTIIETFDHSPDFFKCRAYASTIPVGLDRLDDFRRWNI